MMNVILWERAKQGRGKRVERTLEASIICVCVITKDPLLLRDIVEQLRKGKQIDV